MKKIFTFLFCLFGFSCIAQFKDMVWCFGDSALVNFTSTIPTTGFSSADVRTSPASICDSLGNLLFYCINSDALLLNGGYYPYDAIVFNKNHQIMENGDSLICDVWPYQIICIPSPGNSNQFYVFQQNAVSGAIQSGFYFSIIDLSFNGGLGKVISKNNFLFNFKLTNFFTAVKHGNGRDWWVFFRRNDYPNSNDIFFSYLITPSGISPLDSQQIGSTCSIDYGRIIFNINGNKLLFIGGHGLINVLNFDRCSGLFSNPNIISPEQSANHLPYLETGEISPNSNLIYISEFDTANGGYTNYLRQYDLNASNVLSSQITLDTLIGFISTWSGFSDLKLAPDGKIYVTSGIDCFNPCFPYPYTMHNQFTDYLSVINYPDSIGTACGYERFGFYLGGRRTYQGLPNNPNYELGRLIGSPCDTLTGVKEYELSSTIKIFPNPVIDKFAISGNYSLIENTKLFNLTGAIVMEQDNLRSNKAEINVAHLQPAMYFLQVATKEKIYNFKIVKE